MKTFVAITLAAILGIQSSGREPGATTPKSIGASEVAQGGGSGLPPGAIDAIDLRDSAELPATTFATLDITIDPLGQPLAAYQFELTSADTSFTVVGVEAGEHEAFNHGRPPYFDPVATQEKSDRLILAEYALPELKADALPTQAIRVATVHVMFDKQVDEEAIAAIQLKLTTAGNADGKRIDAKASYSFRTPERPE